MAYFCAARILPRTRRFAAASAQVKQRLSEGGFSPSYMGWWKTQTRLVQQLAWRGGGKALAAVIIVAAGHEVPQRKRGI